jgi:transcriptional regulator with XRE-family HTH domain
LKTKKQAADRPKGPKKPHVQLKKIRGVLHLSQAQTAALLRIDPQYLISLETGQRELSGALATKIAETFGVARIREKHELPMMRGPKGTVRPFTKQGYEEYAFTLPSYRDPDTPDKYTPTPGDYARSAHALLEAARRQGLLRPVLSDFFEWFQRSILGDRMLHYFKHCFDELFPGQRRKSDAYYALTINWGERDEDDYRRLSERREDQALRARKKRKRLRKQKN